MGKNKISRENHRPSSGNFVQLEIYPAAVRIGTMIRVFDHFGTKAGIYYNNNNIIIAS